MGKGSIHIGTSGWSYRHWMGGVFYPETLKAADQLPWYAERFDTVELDGTFYRLPKRETFATWCRKTPDGFRFALKANRYITHMKKLKDPEQSLDRMLAAIGGLGDKLGPVLFQLPPSWKIDLDRLQAFLSALPKRRGYAFEFRHESWFDDRVYAALERHAAAFCIYHLAGRQSPFVVSAPLVYIRLHGPDGAYAGSYHGNTLRSWARRIADWQASGHDVWCFFDNDQNAYAPKNALQLKAQLDSR